MSEPKPDYKAIYDATNGHWLAASGEPVSLASLGYVALPQAEYDALVNEVARLREQVAQLEDDMKRAELIDILPQAAEHFGEVALIVGCGEDPSWSIALDVPGDLPCRWIDDSPERLLATLKAALKE